MRFVVIITALLSYRCIKSICLPILVRSWRWILSLITGTWYEFLYLFIEVSNDPACNVVWNKVWNIFILRCFTTDNDYLETLILFRRLISYRWFVLILLLLTLINSEFLISLLAIKVFASFTAFCKPSFPGVISEMYYTWQLYFSQLLAPGVTLFFLAQYWQYHLGWYVTKFYLVWFKNFLCWCYTTAMYDYFFIFFEISTGQLIQIYKLSVGVHYDHSVFLIFRFFLLFYWGLIKARSCNVQRVVWCVFNVVWCLCCSILCSRV